MQNILPNIKTYSLFIKIESPGKRTFKSSLFVADFTVQSTNFILSGPFDTQNEDIILPGHSALYLDQKYLL